MGETSVQDMILDMIKDHGQKLDKILEQTTKTNGRVNNHDKRLEDLEKTEHNPLTCPAKNDIKWVKQWFWAIITGAITIATTLAVLVVRAVLKI